MDVILVVVVLAGITILALMAWLVRAFRSRQWASTIALTSAAGIVVGLSFTLLLPLYLDSHLPNRSLEPMPATAVKVDDQDLQRVFEGRTHHGTLDDTEREVWIWYEEDHAADGATPTGVDL